MAVQVSRTFVPASTGVKSSGGGTATAVTRTITEFGVLLTCIATSLDE